MALDADKIARTISDRLDTAWLRAKGERLPVEGEADRLLLFTAIAQGIIEHLRTDAEIVLNEPAHTHVAHPVRVNVKERELPDSLGSYDHDHEATCTVTIQTHTHTHEGNIN